MGAAMGIEDSPHHKSEKRIQARETAQTYHSVQFTKKGLDAIYQFKLWDLSQNGMCILVKEDSTVLQHLAIGDILDMTFYPSEAKEDHRQLKTKIKHITKNDAGRFQGHYLVGLAII